MLFIESFNELTAFCIKSSSERISGDCFNNLVKVFMISNSFYASFKLQFDFKPVEEYFS
jgi:hypothetical protein